MAAGPLHNTVEPLRKLAAAQFFADWGDRALLEHFLGQRDEAAFAELVQRHRRLVGSVCRRLLRHEHDAEDAFQAAFLVLALKGRSIRKRQALASWLYGVAYRCAMQIKRQQARQQNREQQAARAASVDPTEEINLRELWAVLEAEIERLPEKHRAPFVLCCLEGKSQEDAALALGWKTGTVSGRLARARQELQERLARKGIALAAVLGATAVGSAEVSAAVVSTTVRSGVAVLSGATAGAVPPKVLAIVKGVSQAMFLSKIKNAIAFIVVVGLLTGVGLTAQQAFFQDRAEPKKDAGKPAKVVADIGKTDPPPSKDLRYDGKPFEYWRDFVTNELKAERRIEAVRAMGAFGVRGYAREGTEVIVKLTREYNEADMGPIWNWYAEPGKFTGTPDQRVILEACLAVVKIGPTAAPVLLKNMDSASPRLFSTGVFSTGVLRLPESELPAVLRLIREGGPEVRAAAVVILLEPYPSEEKWLAILAAAKREDTEKLVQSLTRTVEAPSDTFGGAANGAANLLGRLDGAARPAGTVLVTAALEGNNPALDAIRKIKPDPKMVVALASAALRKKMNRPAVELLRAMGADAKSAVPVLVAALKFPRQKSDGDGEEYVSDRYAIVTALGKIGPEMAQVAAPLALIVGDENQDLHVAHEAFALLRKVETDFEPLVPQLAAYLERMCKARGPTQWRKLTVSPVSEAADVLQILTKLGPKAHKAMPDLLNGFKNGPTITKLAIIKTWTAMGSSARDALPLLFQFVASNESAPGRALLVDVAKEAIKAINK